MHTKETNPQELLPKIWVKFYLLFVLRSPDTSRVRSKMLYASSKDRFKRELDGIKVEIQATDPSEMTLILSKGELSEA